MELLLFPFVAILGLMSTVLYIASILWAYGDAERRGKSGCLVALMVAVFSWPISLIVWLALRPENNRYRY